MRFKYFVSYRGIGVDGLVYGNTEILIDGQLMAPKSLDYLVELIMEQGEIADIEILGVVSQGYHSGRAKRGDYPYFVSYVVSSSIGFVEKSTVVRLSSSLIFADSIQGRMSELIIAGGEESLPTVKMISSLGELPSE